MPVKVVDASALAALLFGEPTAQGIAEQLEGSSLFAPTLLPTEVASVYLKKSRRHPTQRNALLVAFGLLERMDIARVDVDLDAATQLAEQTRLTIYDASYLWLARRLGAELVTLDGALARAAAPS
jgi:predicted nucleic acid-binding protein